MVALNVPIKSICLTYVLPHLDIEPLPFIEDPNS